MLTQGNLGQLTVWDIAKKDPFLVLPQHMKDSLLGKAKAASDGLGEQDPDPDGVAVEVDMDELKRQEEELLRVLNLYKVSAIENERATYLMSSISWFGRCHYYSEDAIGCYKYYGINYH